MTSSKSPADRQRAASSMTADYRNQGGFSVQQWYELTGKEFTDAHRQHRVDQAVQEAIKRKAGQSATGDDMTKATLESIIQAKFDFATLSGCVSDIRKGFWNINRVNEFYQNKLKSTHSHFYQQIIPGRTEERIAMMQRMKRGGFMKHLRLVDDPLQKLKASTNSEKRKVEVRFDSGSERDSYHGDDSDNVPVSEQNPSDDQKSNDSRISRDLTYRVPVIYSKQADQINKKQMEKQKSAQESSTNGGSLGLNSSNYVPRKKHATAVDMLDRAAAMSLEIQKKNTIAQPDSKQQRRKSNNQSPLTKFKSVMKAQITLMTEQDSVGEMSNLAIPTGGEAFATKQTARDSKDYIELKQNASQKRKTVVISRNDKTSIISRQSNKTASSKDQKSTSMIHFYEDMANADFQRELMSDSDLTRITFSLFDKMIKDEDVQAEIAGALSIHLRDRFKTNYNYEEIKKCLPFVDKGLFMSFRGGQLTLAQLKARVAERRGFAKYLTFDDVYAELSHEERQKILDQPSKALFLFGKNPKAEDYNRVLAPWESNPRCLHSIKYHHKKGRTSTAMRSAATRGPKKTLMADTRSPDTAAKEAITKTTIDGTIEAKRPPHTLTQDKNSLIDEKALKSRKARIAKEIQLKKHIGTVTNLKRKLAKQIVNKTVNIAEFKQLKMEDLFQHATDLEKMRIERHKNRVTSFNTADEKEKEKIIEKMWQQRVDQSIVQQVQHYSSNFELDKELGEEQKDISRLKMKLEDDKYAYFQERNNQIQKAFELMSVYKTVFEIETEIKDAQKYLTYANQYYANYQTKKSPTKAEYDYIKRLVDDGQPVVLSRKVKKALKIKDEMEVIERAIKEDLQSAGCKKSEIQQFAPQEIDTSDEESAERRMKSAMNKQGFNSKLAGPRITKKERARLAYQAERDRQKLLQPKAKKNQLSVWDREQQKLQRPRRKSAAVARPMRRQNLSEQQSSFMQARKGSEVPHQDQRLEESMWAQSAIQEQLISASNADIITNERQAQRSKHPTKIEVKKLPKYLSSKLITRNQSNTVLKEEGEDQKIKEAVALGLIQQQFIDLETTRNDDIKLQDIRSTTLKGQDYIDLVDVEHNAANATTPVPQQHHNQISPSAAAQQKRISVSRGYQQATDDNVMSTTQRQTRSAYQLRTLKKFHQTARSVTNVAAKRQRPYSGHIDQVLDETHNELDGEELDEDRSRMMQYTSQMYNGVTPTDLENDMSQSMMDFVYMYGLAVQKAAANKTPQMALDKTRSTALMTTQQNMNSTHMRRGSSTSKNQQMDVAGTSAGRFQTQKEDGKNLMLFEGLDSQDDFESCMGRSSTQLVKQKRTFTTVRAPSSTKSIKRPVRAMTAISRKRPIHDRGDRQDLNFNTRPEAAENDMKAQKLLLYKQKLEQNFYRTGYSSTPYVQQTEEIKTQQKMKQVAAHIVAQTEKNQSSDYNTKAIATRLRSIAQKRIQTAAKQRARIDSDLHQPRLPGHVEFVSTRQRMGDFATHGRQGSDLVDNLGKTTDSNGQLERLNSQLTDMTMTMPEKLPAKGSAWVNNPNVVTLKASTEASNKNLQKQMLHAQRNSFGEAAGHYVNTNQGGSMVKLTPNEFIVTRNESGQKSQFDRINERNKDLSRARSGVHPISSQISLVNKEVEQKRQETMSPFEDIPITSSKKNRESYRPTTGHRSSGKNHHYIQKSKDTNSQLNLINKPSAQTLLA